MGRRQIVGVPAPAAGANWTWQCPGSGRWRLRAACATFAASATVATRYFLLEVEDANGDLLWESEFGGSATAGQTSIVSAGPHGSYGTQSGAIVVGLLDDFLPPLGSVIGNASGIQAGDQWSAIVLTLEEIEDLRTVMLELLPGPAGP